MFSAGLIFVFPRTGFRPDSNLFKNVRIPVHTVLKILLKAARQNHKEREKKRGESEPLELKAKQSILDSSSPQQYQDERDRSYSSWPMR